MRLPATLRALRHRNYKLFAIGNVVSFTGTWIQGTAQGWLVYHLARDPSVLGWVGFAAQVPVLALGLLSGIVIESVNRRRLLVITQSLAMVQAFCLAALTLVHGSDGQPLISVSGVILLATCIGVIQAFDQPARSAFLLQMVSKEDLGNAIALNSLTFNIARMLGPSIAGGLIAVLQKINPDRVALGEGLCFALNGLSFLAVIVQLMRMDVTQPALRRSRAPSEGFMREGMRYMMNRPHLRAMLVHVAFMSLFGMPYLVMMPVFARDVLHGDSTVYGALMSSVGIGALCGGVVMANRSRIQGLGTVIAGATFLFALGLIAFSWLNVTWLSCAMLLLTGFCMVTINVGAHTVIQTLTGESFRGRVLSYHSMVGLGLLPFGSLLIGSNVKMFGPGTGLTINGIVCALAAGILFARLPAIRQAARSSPEYPHPTSPVRGD